MKPPVPYQTPRLSILPSWLALTGLTGLLVLAALQSCTRWAVDREVVWAEMGTPARIVDDREVRVLVSDGEGGFLPGRAVLKGMVALDEPTLQYYQKLDKGDPNE